MVLIKNFQIKCDVCDVVYPDGIMYDCPKQLLADMLELGWTNSVDTALCKNCCGIEDFYPKPVVTGADYVVYDGEAVYNTSGEVMFISEDMIEHELFDSLRRRLGL